MSGLIELGSSLFSAPLWISFSSSVNGLVEVPATRPVTGCLSFHLSCFFLLLIYPTLSTRREAILHTHPGSMSWACSLATAACKLLLTSQPGHEFSSGYSSSRSPQLHLCRPSLSVFCRWFRWLLTVASGEIIHWDRGQESLEDRISIAL